MAAPAGAAIVDNRMYRVPAEADMVEMGVRVELVVAREHLRLWCRYALAA